jgi:hypothetical protein
MLHVFADGLNNGRDRKCYCGRTADRARRRRLALCHGSISRGYTGDQQQGGVFSAAVHRLGELPAGAELIGRSGLKADLPAADAALADRARQGGHRISSS